MNEHVNRATSLGLLLLGTSSICALIITTFSLQASPQIYWWLALLCVLIWIAVVFRKGFLIGMPLSAAVLFFLYRCRSDDLGAELQDLMDAVSSAYFSSFGNSSAEEVFEPAVSSHMVALLLILFLITAFISVSLSAGNFRITLVLLGTLPVFCLCIAVNGTPPVLPVLGMFLFWCGALLSGDAFRLGDAGGRTALMGFLPCLAVLAILLWFFRPSTYQADEQARKVSQRFDRLGNALSDVLDGKNGILSLTGTLGTSDALSGWDHGDGALDLTIPYDFSAQNHEIFVLQTGARGSFYLRGRSFGDYSGTGWLAASENAGSSALSYAAQVVSRSPGSQTYYFSILADQPYEALYLPYYSVTDYIGDVFVPSGGRTAYGGDYYLPGPEASPTQLPDSLLGSEQQYRRYVQSYYTRLPDSTRTVLQNVCLQNGLSSDRDDIVNRVADFVRAGSTYDIGVGPYPDNDYAVYFLTVERRGYCIHYATAACALYRALGIPARVCEGFLITAEPETEITVCGADAHAWVEVYSSGIGWLPVEVTAGSSEPASQETTDSALMNAELNDSTVSEPEEQEPENPSTDTSSPLPGSGDDMSVPGENGGKNLPGSGESENEGDGASGDSVNAVSRPVRVILRMLAFVFAVLAIALLLFLLRYFALSALKNRKLSVQDGRARAIHLYQQAERLLRFGGSIPDAVRIPAEKSCFSLHEISEEELAASRHALDHLTKELYAGMSPWKKFVFRYCYVNTST